MRYFYLTFQTRSARTPSKLLSKRFYIMRTTKYFMYQEVLSHQANAFHDDPRDSNGDTYLGGTSNGVLGGVRDEAHFFEEFRHQFANELLNVHMTEMTPMQRKWFTTTPEAYWYVDSMLSRLYMSNRENRAYDNCIERIRNMRSLRLLGRSRTSDAQIHYKGSYHSNPSLFLSGKQAMRDLATVVNRAIKDEDTDSLDEFFVDNGASVRGIPLNPIFDRIKEALDTNHRIDMGVTYCDCGHFERNDDTHEVRGDTWCESCFNDEAVYVEDRDEYWPRDDAYWSDRHDAYYSFDRDEEDDDNGDPDDLLEYSTNVLNHISPDPKIKSSPHGEFLMGIEFEMTTEGRVRSAVTDVRDQLGDGYCVCKYDGSLSDGGLEIVTAPRGLPEHIRRFKAWNVNSSYRAWDRKCCGMHIHIDSHAFTQMTLGKFIMFINDRNNMEFIRKIAGRHPERDDQARTYAAAEDQQVLVNPSKAVKGKSYERYRMVNLQNLSVRESNRLGFGNRFDEGRYDTVEVRIFRASLKKERLLAQIEFTHAAVMFCRVASWRELNQTTFLKWLKGSAAGLYPHLADWYGVRRRVPVCNEGKQAVCEDQPETVEGD